MRLKIIALAICRGVASEAGFKPRLRSICWHWEVAVSAAETAMGHRPSRLESLTLQRLFAQLSGAQRPALLDSDEILQLESQLLNSGDRTDESS